MSTQDLSRDTAAWTFQVWTSFALSVGAMTVGILYLPVDNWIRGFLGMGPFFSLGSAISLSKTLRDAHEAKRLLNRISEAKAEKILREFDTDSRSPLGSAI